jgi:hypothetical protein
MEVGASSRQRTRLLVSEPARHRVATGHICGWSNRSWFGERVDGGVDEPKTSRFGTRTLNEQKTSPDEMAPRQ